jgi:hypothetical protein
MYSAVRGDSYARDEAEFNAFSVVLGRQILEMASSSAQFILKHMALSCTRWAGDQMVDGPFALVALLTDALETSAMQ